MFYFLMINAFNEKFSFRNDENTFSTFRISNTIFEHYANLFIQSRMRSDQIDEFILIPKLVERVY